MSLFFWLGSIYIGVITQKKKILLSERQRERERGGGREAESD
jgi:hypothetical protein